METIFKKKAEEVSGIPLRDILKKKNEDVVSQRKAEEQKRIDHENWLSHKRLENKNKPLNIKRKDHIKDMLKTLNGLPPHNSCSNICYGDGWFSRSIPGHEGNKEYDTAMEELIKEFGPISTWGRFMEKELW